MGNKLMISNADIPYLYIDYGEDDFLHWWNSKITGLGYTEDITDADRDVLQSLSIPQKYHDYEYVSPGKVYGFRASAYDPENKIIHQVIPVTHEEIWDLMNDGPGEQTFLLQVHHIIWLQEPKKMLVHLYIDDIESVHTIEVHRDPLVFDYMRHGQILDYFNTCLIEQILPNESSFEFYINTNN